jgi:hypothetical protein
MLYMRLLAHNLSENVRFQEYTKYCLSAKFLETTNAAIHHRQF